MLNDIISENIPMGIILTQNGRIQYMNEWAFQFTGYSGSDIKNRPFLELVHPDDHKKLIKRYQVVMSGNQDFEGNRYRIIARQGEIFWIRFRSRVVDYKGSPALLSFLIDETQNKNHETTLIRSEERYRELVDNIAEGVVVVMDGEIRFINKTLRDKLGIEIKDIAGTSFLDFIHPDDQALVLERYEKRLKGEEVSDAYELRLIKPGGEELICELRPSLITWEGRPATQTAILDITDRKKAEKEKKRLHERLIRMEKMESLGILAGGVAHDLNNVLSGIVTYPELLLMDLPDSHRLRKPLELIYGSGLKASAIVNDLLTLARRGVIATGIVNLNQVILDYLASPEHQKLLSYYPDITVKTQLSDSLNTILGSEIHLRTTIMNLVSNAAEAQPSGGTIKISTKNEFIDTPIQGYDSIKEGEFVVVEIEDHGLGINSADLQRIFEPFYTKKVMGRSGTGLGMAVVWGTVVDHNGYINVKSVEDQGTIFYLYFPIVHGQVVSKKEPVLMDDYLGNSETILVVDDVKEQRQIARNILTRLNYSIDTVSSGEAAIDFLASHSCDLVLLDMVMDPGIDGLETFKRIIAEHPSQKVILASGFSETEQVNEAQKLGAGPYVKKPYSIEYIGLTLKAALHKDN